MEEKSVRQTEDNRSGSFFAMWNLSPEFQNKHFFRTTSKNCTSILKTKIKKSHRVLITSVKETINDLFDNVEQMSKEGKSEKHPHGTT